MTYQTPRASTTHADQPTLGHRTLRRPVSVGVVVTAVLLLLGGLALALGLRAGTATGAADVGSTGGQPPQPSVAVGDPGPTATGATPFTTTTPSSPTSRSTTPASAIGAFLPASAPTSLQIPSIKLRSSTFVPLDVQANGTISVPGTENEVGLYRGGPTPGQLGPAVLAGHVDSPDGRKGIFWDLGRVKAGDQVKIARADGSKLSFTVDKVSAYRKSAFPTDLVYKGDFDRSEIRLVTCGGPVDSANEYRDNVIVFAHLTHTIT